MIFKKWPSIFFNWLIKHCLTNLFFGLKQSTSFRSSRSEVKSSAPPSRVWCSAGAVEISRRTAVADAPRAVPTSGWVQNKRGERVGMGAVERQGLAGAWSIQKHGLNPWVGLVGAYLRGALPRFGGAERVFEGILHHVFNDYVGANETGMGPAKWEVLPGIHQIPWSTALPRIAKGSRWDEISPTILKIRHSQIDPNNTHLQVDGDYGITIKVGKFHFKICARSMLIYFGATSWPKVVLICSLRFELRKVRMGNMIMQQQAALSTRFWEVFPVSTRFEALSTCFKAVLSHSKPTHFQLLGAGAIQGEVPHWAAWLVTDRWTWQLQWRHLDLPAPWRTSTQKSARRPIFDPDIDWNDFRTKSLWIFGKGW